MLKHTKGNLITLAGQGEFDFIIQGCNCHCTFGSGIAREIAQRCPEAYAADKLTKFGDYLKLGMYTKALISNFNNEFTIINAYTQFSTSKMGEDVFEYAAFELILQKIAHLYGDQRMGLPYIGMGLAGGDKTRIIPLIEKFAETVADKGGSVTLVEFG